MTLLRMTSSFGPNGGSAGCRGSAWLCAFGPCGDRTSLLDQCGWRQGGFSSAELAKAMTVENASH